MTRELIKRSYLAAALSAAGIIGAIVLYAVVGEILARAGHKPPLLPPAAYAVKYAVYILSIASVFAVRFAASRLDARRATPEAADPTTQACREACRRRAPALRRAQAGTGPQPRHLRRGRERR